MYYFINVQNINLINSLSFQSLLLKIDKIVIVMHLTVFISYEKLLKVDHCLRTNILFLF